MFNDDKKFDKAMEIIDDNMYHEFHLAVEYESQALIDKDNCIHTKDEYEQLAREHMHEFFNYALLKQKILDTIRDL